MGDALIRREKNYVWENYGKNPLGPSKFKIIV